MKTSSRAREQVREALAELQRMRGEARLRLHLASLDARSKWDLLETRILGLEQRLDLQGERAGDATLQLIENLRRTLVDFAEKHLHRVTENDVVRSVMTPDVAVCSPEDPLSRAAQIMWERDCGGVPVVDAERRVAGMITDRDVCMTAYMQGSSPSAVPVSSAMSRDVSVCGAEAPISAACQIMSEKKVRRLPVTDGDGRLIGIVSLGDVARHARGRAIDGAAMVGRTLADISDPRFPSRRAAAE